MKQQYIRRYGNAYVLPSPKAGELMEIFRRRCRENDILSDPEACFAYINELPDPYPQMSIFEM